MKKRFLILSLAAALLLTACGQPVPREDKLTIVATTYPVYLFASSVTEGVDGVEVLRLDTGSTSCLHDYNLTVNDMKKIERADVIALNGVGLEEFMEDALHTSDALVIDCSEGVHLLENESHHHDEHDHSHDGHDHGHFDPHYWMDAENALVMVENIAEAMVELDADNAKVYQENGEEARQELQVLDDLLETYREGLDVPGLITFHDGFRYFCHAYGLDLLESIEEEAGSEASAKEIVEITHLVKEHDIPVIFTEVNGSDATAKAIVRETDCAIAQLSMCMDGPDDNLNHYLNAMLGNMAAIVNGFAGEEVVTIQ
jgi:ABC-type Zn uptake system ZnuABC Zn-binding protein ZnuA